jgi:hypothetical protein
MSNETETKEFEYTGDANAFQAELAKLNAEPVEEAAEETVAAEEVTEAEETTEEATEATEEVEATEEEAEDDEEEGADEISKEVLDKLDGNPEFRKAIQSRIIRETKQELKDTRTAWQTEREEKILLAQRLEAMEKAVDIYFKGGKNPVEAEAEEGWLDQDAEREVKEIKETLKKQQEEKAIDTARAALYSQAAKDGATFAEKNPDYYDAVNHALKVKFAEFKALGMDEKDAQARVNQWGDLVAYTATQKGKSIAEYGYSLAKDMGYAPKAKVVKKGPNLDAIRENQKKTGDKPSSIAGVKADSGQIKTNSRGEVDPADFQKLLASLGG